MKAQRLEDIGFYTLSDYRASNASATSPMWRCELIVTGECNFKCKYCRGMISACNSPMPIDKAKKVVGYWAKDGLRNIRFSGGEPTMYEPLADLISWSSLLGVQRIAISTNGSASLETYNRLLGAGANDFSVSLDACCAADGDMMAGKDGAWDKVVEGLRFLALRTYTTVGIVLTGNNIEKLNDTIRFASSLGVADIRIIPAAQCGSRLENKEDLSPELLAKHPILAYRVENLHRSRPVRGIGSQDSTTCRLLRDDSMVAGDWHFPCIIYFREGGSPIGRIGPRMRQERLDWMLNHDTSKDPICCQNCLDVCVDYNNKAATARTT